MNVSRNITAALEDLVRSVCRRLYFVKWAIHHSSGKGLKGTMTDLIVDEEELSLLRRENQTLRAQADVLEETISLQREQIDLKGQLIAALQWETMLLTQQVQEMEDHLKKDSSSSQMPSSVRFSRPSKSLRKKNR